METKQLGNSKINITPIILGTWQTGKKMWVGIDDQESIKAIRTAVDAGINTIDTAEVYGDGHSETIIAEAVSHLRDRLVYATKVFANHLKYEQVIEACEGSLRRLKTDYLDLYQIHWPSGSWNTEIIPIEETMKALNTLKEQGKIRAIGVSNFNHQQLKEASQYGRIDSLQPPYSLFWRQVEQDALPYCVENNISILAYSPLAQGILTGKFKADHQFLEGDHRAKNKLFLPDNYARVQSALSQLQIFTEKYNCNLAQLALAWLIAQPQTNVISGVRNEQQILENIKAIEVKISPEDLNKIDQISQTVTSHLDSNPVLWKLD